MPNLTLIGECSLVQDSTSFKFGKIAGFSWHILGKSFWL